MLAINASSSVNEVRGIVFRIKDCDRLVRAKMLKYFSIILFLFMFGSSTAVAQNELKRDQYLFAFEELFKEKKFKEATKYINYLLEGSYNIDIDYYFQFGLNYYELCDLSKADALFDIYYQKAGNSGKSYK